MGQKLAGLFTGLISGYLLGMIIGFSLFDPNQDVWALFGAVFALAGMGIGFTSLFQRNMATILMALIGFYFGSLIGILLVGNIVADDLLEVLQNRTIFFSIGGTVLGGWFGRRLPAEKASIPLLAFLLGGFLGGYALGVVCHLAPYPSLVGWSPFVIGSGLIIGGIVTLLKRRIKG